MEENPVRRSTRLVDTMKKKSAPRSTLNVEKDYPKSPISPISTPSVGPSTAMSDVEAAARAKLQSLRKDSLAFCLLNALLANAPTVEGVEVIATDIIDASEQSDGLDQLAEFYKTGLLLPMKAGGRTPQVSFHPSRDPEIKSEANAIAIDLETAKRDPTTLKKYSLHRDGYRCVATRRWDYSSLSLPRVKEKFDPIDEATITEAAHILPFSLMSVDTNKTLFKKCTIWSVIKSFTNIEFMELSGDYINSLTNVITLDALLHKSFGLLHLWFEAVPGTNNSYIVRKANDYFMPGIVKDGTRVTFTSFGPENLPLPDPHYLAFQAAVSKVVHMAGMAEHLDEILRKYEDIRVLSDQSSVEYLDGLLCTTQKCIIAY